MNWEAITNAIPLHSNKKSWRPIREGKGSYRDISIAHNIHADSTVLQWVSQHNNPVKLTNSRPKGAPDMVKTKGRKTTYGERIEIVEDCFKKAATIPKRL